jgi:hypothetical protein
MTPSGISAESHERVMVTPRVAAYCSTSISTQVPLRRTLFLTLVLGFGGVWG